jgi:hypothetical protein
VIVLVKNNTKPDLTIALKRGGVKVDLTGATINFKLKKPSGAVLIKAMVLVGAATNGKVALSWGAGDLDEAGECQAEIQVTYGDGAVQNSKYAIPVYVRDEFQEKLG